MVFAAVKATQGRQGPTGTTMGGALVQTTVEVTPFFGYRTGDNFIGAATGRILDDHGASSIGVIADVLVKQTYRNDGSLPIHAMMLIQHGVYLLENLELEALAAARAYEFAFIVQPLKIKGATGSAIAPVAAGSIGTWPMRRSQSAETSLSASSSTCRACSMAASSASRGTHIGVPTR